MNEINFEINDIEEINLSMDVGVKEIYPPIENLKITPIKEQQIFKHENSYGYDEVIVDPIPEEYIIPDGILPITENTTYDVRRFAKVTASVHPTPNLQEKEVTPTKEIQTVVADENYDGLNEVVVNPIPSEYIVPTGTKDIITNGYYEVLDYEGVNVNVPEPVVNLQDKSITITENGTQNIVADEGFDGLNSVEVVTNVAGASEPVVEPDYITDGLISWWEGEDGFDENVQWHSRVGTDYIIPSFIAVGTAVENPPIFKDNALCNTGFHGMTTQQDYCKKDYTIQVVGYFDGAYNTEGRGMNMIVAMNMGASPMIGIDSNFACKFAHGSNIKHSKSYTIGQKKIFNASLNFSNAPSRGGTSSLNHLCSVNGEDWFTATASSAQHTSQGANMVVLGYYGRTYRSCGARVYSIRVYNRKLTLEELQHNYAIDNARFNITE